MEPVTIRPFSRGDRDQLTALVNAHARAVIPGVSVSVNAVLSQLEGEPREFITDPWVTQRATLVAELRGRVVGAALVLMYGHDDSVGPAYRGHGEIRWLLFWSESPSKPANPFWPDPAPAGRELLAAATRRLRGWGATCVGWSGSLPAPGVYGLPAQWPHVRSALADAGYTHDGDSESVLVASLERMPLRALPQGMTVRRSVGINGTRFTAMVDDALAGYVETELLDEPHYGSARPLLADIGNFEVMDGFRRRGIGGALLMEAGRFLNLAGAHTLACLRFAGRRSVARLPLRPGLRGRDPDRTRLEPFTVLAPPLASSAGSWRALDANAPGGRGVRGAG